MIAMIQKIKRISICLCLVLLLSCEKDIPNLEDEATLKSVAGDLWIGMLYDNTYEAIDRTIFEREANAGQVSWYPAWGGWEGMDAYDLAEVNAEINYIHNQGLPVMMHMFFGPDQYLPEWFKEGTWTITEMDTLMHDLIKTTIQSNDNAAKVKVWNVINEAIGWDGDYWDDSKWLEMGYEKDVSGLSGSEQVFDSIPVYIGKAFRYARMYTNEQLELRDYNNEGTESRWGNSEIKSKAFYQLTKHLVNSGVPIDAVGFQGHFNIDVITDFSKLTETTRKFDALGLKIYITEMDAEQNDESKEWNESIAKTQADFYYQYVSAALEGGADGIFTWGIRDDQDPWWRFGENPLLFDAAGKPKDSYYAVKQALIDFSK